MRGITTVVTFLLCATLAGCAGRSSTPDTPAPDPGQAGGTPSAPAPAPAGAPNVSTAGATAAATLTPDDLDRMMKTIGARYGALMKKVQASDAMGAADDARALASTFGEVEKFWEQHHKADAVTLAQQARVAATDAAGAAAAGDVMKTQSAATAMGGACKQCHGAYREGDPQAGFRIKAGVL